MGIFGSDEVKADQPVAEPEKAFTAKDMLEFAKTFAEELKKPSAEEQAKIDAERGRMLSNQQSSILAAQQRQAMTDAQQNACGHMKGPKYEGQTTVAAPLHSDGLHHPICLRCNKQFPPFAPGNNTIPPGSSLSDYTGVTPQLLMAWGNRYAAEQEQIKAAKNQVAVGA